MGRPNVRLAGEAGADEVVLFERASFLVIAHVTRRPHGDRHRFEKVSNIVKQFKLTCSKGQGAFAGLRVSPDGKVLSEAEWDAHKDKWLPTDEDRAYVTSLMGAAVTQPGQFAHWIAPPVMGINRQPVDFAYVRFA